MNHFQKQGIIYAIQKKQENPKFKICQIPYDDFIWPFRTRLKTKFCKNDGWGRLSAKFVHMKSHRLANKENDIGLKVFNSAIARKTLWFKKKKKKNSRMENDKTIMMVSKWFLTHVEYIGSKISVQQQPHLLLLGQFCLFFCWATFSCSIIYYNYDQCQ